MLPLVNFDWLRSGFRRLVHWAVGKEAVSDLVPGYACAALCDACLEQHLSDAHVVCAVDTGAPCARRIRAALRTLPTAGTSFVTIACAPRVWPSTRVRSTARAATRPSLRSGLLWSPLRLARLRAVRAVLALALALAQALPAALLRAQAARARPLGPLPEPLLPLLALG